MTNYLLIGILIVQCYQALLQTAIYLGTCAIEDPEAPIVKWRKTTRTYPWPEEVVNHG